jgi:carbon monoxide dehydrogenase subunit G
MHYSTEIVIDLPRHRVIELFDNPDNLSKWQSGLQRFDFIGGEEGQALSSCSSVPDIHKQIPNSVDDVKLKGREIKGLFLPVPD